MKKSSQIKVIKYLVVCQTLLLAQSFSSAQEIKVQDKKTEVNSKNANIPSVEIKNFVDVFEKIKKEYADKKTNKELIHNAIKGMLSELDPHSVYLEKDELNNFNKNTSGTYDGFGVVLDIVGKKLVVVSALRKGPAERAGIKSLDEIIKINDIVVDELEFDNISDLLVGKDGNKLNKVNFTIKRKEKTFSVDLVKEEVSFTTVEHEIIDSNYGYIYISQFQKNTLLDFNSSLVEIQKSADNLEGLIIDLRGNPGGLVSSATGIADIFLDSGLIVSIKNNNNGEEEKIHATKKEANKLPLVIIINQGSASAAELLAGALQSHKRAIIVGQKSFGKGSVQNVIHLQNGDAIKITTARYFTPNGNSIQAKGITPDIILDQLKVKEIDVNLVSYSEKDIQGHLPEIGDDNKEGINRASTDLAKEDCQLFEALNILKTINFTKVK